MREREGCDADGCRVCVCVRTCVRVHLRVFMCACACACVCVLVCAQATVEVNRQVDALEGAMHGSPDLRKLEALGRGGDGLDAKLTYVPMEGDEGGIEHGHADSACLQEARAAERNGAGMVEKGEAAASEGAGVGAEREATGEVTEFPSRSKSPGERDIGVLVEDGYAEVQQGGEGVGGTEDDDWQLALKDRDDDETDSGGQGWNILDPKDDEIVEFSFDEYSNSTQEGEYSSSSVLPVGGSPFVSCLLVRY